MLIISTLTKVSGPSALRPTFILPKVPPPTLMNFMF
jgi:hypothetical protein